MSELLTGNEKKVQEDIQNSKKQPALAKAIMESAVGDILKKISEAACKFVGVEPSIFATAFGALRDIIQNPGRFFGALGKGFVQGLWNKRSFEHDASRDPYSYIE